MDIDSGGARIPEECESVQVNFCKNPRCANFGVPASTEKQPRGLKVEEGGRDTYTISGAGGHRGYTSSIRCNLCKETPPLKNNKAIVEELNRISSYLAESPDTCTNDQCENHTINLSADRSRYQAFGKTKAGSQRYRCKLCKSTFIVGDRKPHHRLPHKNVQIFRLLVNKMPLKRISEVADISMPTLYDKIDFIHERCLAFAATRERKLLEGTHIRRLYIAADRQDYIVNWSHTEDKRNIQMSAIGSADNTTGYVFGLHLNFDPSLDRSVVELDAGAVGDYEKKAPFRKYARFWLSEDYKGASERGRLRRYTSKSLPLEIESTYQEASEREDVEAPDEINETIMLPAKGMQVHSETRRLLR